MFRKQTKNYAQYLINDKSILLKVIVDPSSKNKLCDINQIYIYIIIYK